MKPQIWPFFRFFRVFSLLTLLAGQVTSSEELTNVKIIGGYVAECSETSPPQTNSLQPMIFNILSSKKTGSVLNAEFEAQFVECSKNKWEKLKSVRTEFNTAFTDEVGQNIKEKINFSKFRVQVLNTMGKVIQTIPVSINGVSKFRFKVKANGLDITKDPETNTKYVDVVLLADRKRNTSADYFFEEVNWGRVRLHLDQPPAE